MNYAWKLINTIDSSDQNVKKYVFKNYTAVAEAVLYKYPTYQDRTVICCSTQSGCPVGCRFCGSGDYFVRNLTVDEIVDQPRKLLEDTGVDPANMKRLQIMFMSMGEPLLCNNLIPAVEKLYEMYPNAALLVSTSAPRVDYSAIESLSIRVPTVGLQFSVHESTDAARDALIPFKAKLTLAEIAKAGESWHKATGRRPFFNYCVHDKNNTQDDVDRLADLFNPSIWNATISVVCERDEHVAAANARQEKLAQDFSGALVGKGFDVRVFNPAGQDDIGGGCGQLWFVQDWMKNNPDLARPSIGHGKPKLHTPQIIPIVEVV